MDIDAYFDRIAYHGTSTPTLSTLRRLHRAHLLAVPFENLDIHLGRAIVLDERALFDKLVTRRRGGFCYEQNGLFAAVLRELGFDVTLLEARVFGAEGQPGIPFDHLTLVVTLDERWLVDVGFGDSFLEPLRLDTPGVQVQHGELYRVTHDGARGLYARRKRGGDWRDEYTFSLTPRRLSDFSGACTYHQSSPESSFTRRRVCSRATPEGRVTLSDRRLIITRNGTRDERELPDDAAFRAALREHFGILLDGLA